MQATRLAETLLKPLELGKIPIEVLQRTVLSRGGAKSDAVVLGSKAGVDFAAVRVKGGYLISSSDPVTGVRDGIGAYAVNVNANDVATSGSRPEFLESVILLQEGASEKDLMAISDEIDRTARGLGMSVLGGHTEVTPGLKRPIVVMTAFATARGFVSSAMARPGDSILMTKTAGVEGTAAVAEALKGKSVVRASTISRASGFVERMSVVEEAVRAYGTGKVRAMHDCTEGGVLGAVYEMSLASGIGFVLEEGDIPVARETKEMCGVLGIDPAKLIASGALLMSVKRGDEDEVLRSLKGTSRVTKIGEFTKKGRVLRRDHRVERVDKAPTDELWRVFGRKAGRPSLFRV